MGSGKRKNTGESNHLDLPSTKKQPFSAFSTAHASDRMHMASRDHLCGYIFLCSGQTKPECYRYRVFGLPALRIDVVAKIKPTTKLFLFDFHLKLLYGVYIAASAGTMNLEPNAFGGKFPAQVKFDILKDCLPLPENVFRHVIKDNYEGAKFRQELNSLQVDKLMSLFPPLEMPPLSLIIPNIVRSQRVLPFGIEELMQPPDNFFPSNQDAAQLRYSRTVTGPGSYDVPRVIESPFELHELSTSAHRDAAFPTARSEHFSHRRSLSFCDSQCPADVLQSSFNENSSFSLQAPHNRYSSTNVPNNSDQVFRQLGAINERYYNKTLESTPSSNLVQGYTPPSHVLAPKQSVPSSMLAAAYWEAVDSENKKQVNSGSLQFLGSAGAAVGEARSPSTVPPHELCRMPSSSLLVAYWKAVANETSDQVNTDPKKRLVVPEPASVSNAGHSVLHETAALQGSSVSASYWVALASKDPEQAYFSHQMQTTHAGESRSTSLGDFNTTENYTTVQLHYPANSVGQTHLPSSSSVYLGQHQMLTSNGGDHVATIYSGNGAPPEAFVSVQVPTSSTNFSHHQMLANHGGEVIHVAANTPTEAQAHMQMQLPLPGHFPSASAHLGHQQVLHNHEGQIILTGPYNPDEVHASLPLQYPATSPGFAHLSMPYVPQYPQ